MPTPRIIVCEDDARTRRLLVKTLGDASSGVDVIAEAASGEAACDACAAHTPDLLLLDLELPGIGGLDVVERLHRRGAPPEILILTSFRDEAKVFEAIKAGAAGYLVKGSRLPDLARAIADVLAGGTVIDPTLARRFWNHFASVRGRRPDIDYALTADEIEVLSLVARGLSNPEAAHALGASRRSIKRHLESIFRKLDVSGRVAATVKALEAGIIEV